MDRPEYALKLTINGKSLSRVIIDQHYRVGHPELDDSMILRLVQELNGQYFDLESTVGEFEYFKAEPVVLDEKPYRVIFIMCISEDFLGVINAFRVRI